MTYPIEQNKNLVINGNFDIWQRGTSFAAIASNTYSSDRFLYSKSGVMVHTAARSTDVPTVAESGTLSNYSMLLTLTTPDDSIAASDVLNIQHRIEGYDYARIAQKKFTLSFWVKATTTGIYCVSFRNSGGDRSFVAEYTIDTTDTWEKKTITVDASPSAGTWDYTNGIGINVGFAVAMGSTFHTTADAWNTGNFLATSNQVNGTATGSTSFRIAQVQVEEGTNATSFEIKNFADEVERCQRYFEKSYNLGVDPGAVTQIGAIGFRAQGTTHIGTRPYSVKKRVAPTKVYFNATTGSTGTWRDANAVADRTVTNLSQAGERNVGYNVVSTVDGNIMAGHWTADSEL